MSERIVTVTQEPTDPADRRWRLAQVYRLLVDLAREKPAARQNSGQPINPGA